MKGARRGRATIKSRTPRARARAISLGKYFAPGVHLGKKWKIISPLDTFKEGFFLSCQKIPRRKSKKNSKILTGFSRLADPARVGQRFPRPLPRPLPGWKRARERAELAASKAPALFRALFRGGNGPKWAAILEMAAHFGQFPPRKRARKRAGVPGPPKSALPRALFRPGRGRGRGRKNADLNRTLTALRSHRRSRWKRICIVENT